MDRHIEKLSERRPMKETDPGVKKYDPINPASLQYKKYIRLINFEHKFYQTSVNGNPCLMHTAENTERKIIYHNHFINKYYFDTQTTC